jgi:O-antigen/teichoic acid export membrane protein
MSRIRNFTRGFFTGYLALGANLLFTLASVPLALRYLGKEEFAIWALVTQISGYIGLIDFGLGASASRLLADHKDAKDGGGYGSVLKTAHWLFFAQGLAMTLAGYWLGSPLQRWMEVPAALQKEFTTLLAGLAAVMGLTCWTKILAVPFWCHQRYEIINYGNVLHFLVRFGVQALGFALGWGIFSLLAGFAAGYAIATIVHVAAVARFHLFPKKGAWGRIDRKILAELLHYGRDVFMMLLGSQLLSASQLIIVGRTMGLEAAATWSVCTRAFSLLSLMVEKIYEYASGAMAEMMVQQQAELLARRFRDVVALTAAGAALMATLGAATNDAFVAWWTSGKFSWSLPNDILMGFYLFFYTVTRCHTNFVGLTKKIAAMRYIYLLEGASFVALAWWAAPHFGFTGVIIAGLLAMLAWSGIYGVLRSAHYFRLSPGEVSAWAGPALLVAALIAPLGGAAWWLARQLPAPWGLLLAGLGFFGSGGVVMLCLGLPERLRGELLCLLRRLVPTTASS